MENWKRVISVLLSAVLLLGMIPGAIAQEAASGWKVGFARRQIALPENSAEPLYIAGYNSAWEIAGVLDLCEARAVWLDAGEGGVLLIGVDCIALDSGTVGEIRAAIGEIPGCIAINVFATHTHAGPDTLGLWGPTGVNGKNSDYMKNLVAAAAEAGQEAAANPREGRLFFGYAETQDMYRDSWYPYVFDPNLYQLRFEASDGSAGTRVYI